MTLATPTLASTAPAPAAPRATRGVYGISVAAELVGMGVQMLRLYERRGLLEPDRTAGGTRRYSEQDLVRLRRIGDLLGAGLNLAGVGLVLSLETDVAQLRADNARLRAERDQSWLTTAAIPQPAPRRPSSTAPAGRSPSARTR